MQGRRILVVEDDFLIAEWLCQAISEHGALISGPAGSAKEAIDLLDKSVVEGALLDLRLRNSIGLEVAVALRQRGIPFIVVTAYDRESLPSELKTAPYLRKPILQDHLIHLARRTFDATH
jgi:CheY-like chemotaxis protein